MNTLAPPSLSSFINTPMFQEQPANVEGAIATAEQQQQAIANEQLAAYQAQQAYMGSMMQGLGGIVGNLGSAAILGGGLKGFGIPGIVAAAAPAAIL